tara:strand:- start:125 stop:403 length:279 start_codon:yes stop_codon:yes gene_type:complete
MKMKPYYLIESWSNTARKLQTLFVQNEMAEKDRCRDIKDAYQRSIQYSASLSESKLAGVTDWEPRVRLVNDSGNYLLDAQSILKSSRRHQDY